MSAWTTIGVAFGTVLLLYAGFVVGLVLAGRRNAALAAARFIPDCVVLFRRLLADPRVPRRHKVLLAALIGYLLMPLDLVPDFIPVAGQLDDAILVVVVLRVVLRSGGPELLDEHWPGPRPSLRIMSRLAFGRGGSDPSPA